jgi:hypothetical protein
MQTVVMLAAPGVDAADRGRRGSGPDQRRPRRRCPISKPSCPQLKETTMRIATALLALFSVLACTPLALADQTATSTDEARRIAEQTRHDAHATARPVRLPAVASSTDDIRALAEARVHVTRPARIQLAAMPAPLHVTSTDEARVAAGQAERHQPTGLPRVTSMQ